FPPLARPPPLSTLFPYTTLFRSGLHEQVGANVEVFLDGLGNFDGSTITTGLNYALYDGEFRKDHSACLVYFENRWPYGLRPEPGDRKSTRLNSSHVKTSYAVFCL